MSEWIDFSGAVDITGEFITNDETLELLLSEVASPVTLRFEKNGNSLLVEGVTIVETQDGQFAFSMPPEQSAKLRAFWDNESPFKELLDDLLAWRGEE